MEVKMDLFPQINIENKQIVTLSQMQSLEILAMDAVELEEFLQNEYLTNPMLEHESNEEMFSNIEDFSNWYDNQYRGRAVEGEIDRGEDNGYSSGGEFAAADTEYLKKYLISQLDIKSYTRDDWSLLQYLIDCLEDDGFFTMETAEVASLTGRKETDVRRCLELLRALEPYGIFAQDLPHCLLRQLEVLGIEDENLESMITTYLPEIAEGKISTISRGLGLSTAVVRKYITIIGSLNPRPLAGLNESDVTYIVPDIVYSQKGDRWEITINEGWSGSYHINEYYLRMMKESKDQELFEYFKTKLDRSRFILNSIEQRKKTMKSISECILERQREYFDGKGPLRPMTMTALADDMEVHPSTISRAIHGKYIQVPRGTILMRNLFSGQIGDETTAVCIKEHIKELIDHENKRSPYSDAKLVELLAGQNIHISRRAVAKYRDELWIKGSFDRKVR